MKIATLINKFERTVSDNSPAIMTGIGVVGTVATAYLASKATLSAERIISSHEEQLRLSGEPGLTGQDAAKLIWREYVPAVATGALTIACIIGANRVQSKRASAIAAAYSVSANAFSEYKSKVAETIGEKKAEAIHEEIVRDRMEQNPPNDATVVITGTGDVLCKDEFSGRYFKSDMESLRKAENDINFQIRDEGYASVSDLYFLLGIPETAISQEVGWNHDHPLRMHFTTVMSPDNRPCISMDFDLHPRRKFSHLAGT